MHIQTAKELFLENAKEIIIEEEQILAFAKEHFHKMDKLGLGSWNGRSVGLQDYGNEPNRSLRQIRNAFQTAIALAEMDATKCKGTPILKDTQFEVVSKASRAFDDYLLRTQGGTTASLAKTSGIRNDRDYRLRRQNDKSRKNTMPVDPYPNRRHNKKDVVSELEDDDSDDSDDTSESEPEMKKGRKKGKSHEKAKTEKKSKHESLDEESSNSEKLTKEKEKKKKKKKKRDEDEDN